MAASPASGGELVLALETSCDDTCAAVVDRDGGVLSNVISSQGIHDRFGGVVPEVASRHHVELVNAVLAQALADAGAELGDVSLVGVTQGPGLIGALLVGLSTAKALAASRALPLAPVDHLQGHIAANFLRICAPDGRTAGTGGARSGAASAAPTTVTGSADRPAAGPAANGAAQGLAATAGAEPFEPPFLCLIASGGHTLLAHVRAHDGYEVLGSTLDDAAGEAFDKGARMLGLGYPGGPALERLAAEGDAGTFAMPVLGGRGRPGAGVRREAFARSLDFSFAGLKTALWQRVRELSDGELAACRADLAASYQAAIVESLALRLEQALAETRLERVAVGGGVAANGPLRARLRALGVCLHVPPAVLCTDNAAMIASAARFTTPLQYPDYLSLEAFASGESAPSALTPRG